MGYESKLIIAKRDVWTRCGSVWFEKLAEINMSVCGTGFRDIFTTEIESDIFGDGFEKGSTEDTFVMTEDCYGKVCKYTDLQTVIDYMEKEEAKEHYRRYAVALAMLKAFQAEEWESSLVVIHYGY